MNQKQNINLLIKENNKLMAKIRLLRKLKNVSEQENLNTSFITDYLNNQKNQKKKKIEENLEINGEIKSYDIAINDLKENNNQKSKTQENLKIKKELYEANKKLQPELKNQLSQDSKTIAEIERYFIIYLILNNKQISKYWYK